MNESLAVRQPAAINPQEVDIFRLGEVFAKSGYFTDAKDASQAIVKILAGREIGIGAMASMTGFHIVQGKPTLSANLIASIIKNKNTGYDYKVLELTDSVCEIEFFQFTPVAQANNLFPQLKKESLGKSRFTIDEARNAGLTNKDVWKKHPKNMLFARAISNGAKWFCPDVFNGATVYTPEELNANVGDDGDIIVDSFAPQSPSLPDEFSGEKRTVVTIPDAMKTVSGISQPPQTRTEELQQHRQQRKPTREEKAYAILDKLENPVERKGDNFIVTEVVDEDTLVESAVGKDAHGKVNCNCADYKELVQKDAAFRCEHILAVKFALLKNSNAEQKAAA